MVPQDLFYTKEHEWAKIEGDIVTVGITEHAQEALGEITFVELPAEGKDVEAAGEIAVVESSKAASDVYSPLSGAVTEINDTLESQPEVINSDCYGQGWLCKLKASDLAEKENLMDAAAYTKYLSTID